MEVRVGREGGKEGESGMEGGGGEEGRKEAEVRRIRNGMWGVEHRERMEVRRWWEGRE